MRVEINPRHSAKERSSVPALWPASAAAALPSYSSPSAPGCPPGQHAVVVLGPAPFGRRDFLDERGRFPLLGVTTRDVKRVELRYSEGPPLVGDTGDGGFVLLADAWRRPREPIAYDATGRVLERADMRGNDMRYLCEQEPAVCPPEASSSSR
jgi:hypothetical protein